MSQSPLKNVQSELSCYAKRFVKMTQELTYTRREFPGGVEEFSYSYSEDPGQNETEMTREDYKAVRGIKEWLLDLEDIKFTDKDISNLRVNVRKTHQIILETSAIKLFNVHGKFSGSDVKGTVLFKSRVTQLKAHHSFRIAKSMEFKLRGYTTFTGQFAFNRMVVKSDERWEEGGFTATNYLLDNKKYQLIQALPEDARVGDSGVFMEIKDNSDEARLSWRLENKFGRICLAFVEEASRVQRKLSYSITDLYELDLEGNFYHYQTRLEFSNGDGMLLNRDDIFAVPKLP